MIRINFFRGEREFLPKKKVFPLNFRVNVVYPCSLQILCIFGISTQKLFILEDFLITQHKIYFPSPKKV
jgi:hypothetical protein